jgi:uncharacterized protein YlxW (UPF0749 family)
MIIIGFVCLVVGYFLRYLVHDTYHILINHNTNKVIKNSQKVLDECRKVTRAMQDDMEELLKTIKKYEAIFDKLKEKSSEFKAAIDKELAHTSYPTEEPKILTAIKLTEKQNDFLVVNK